MRSSSCDRWRAFVLVLLLLFAPASLVALPRAAAPAQAFTSLKQVAVLMHPAHPTDPVQRKEMEEAARALGLQLRPAAVRAPEDFEAAFKAVGGAGGLLNIDTPLFTTYRTQFVELAARNRLPAIWSNGIIVEAGGLMSYGTYIPALFRRAATYVDKVLKGARPGDLPSSSPRNSSS